MKKSMKEWQNKNQNVLFLTHWSFNDPLIQTYTLPYVKIIRKILPIENKMILVTSEQKKNGITDQDIIKINQNWEKENIKLKAQKYRAMGFIKILQLLKQILSLVVLIKINKITTIHCFCTPAGSIGYFLSKITGARLILDSYEPHAESMVENGTWSKKSLAYSILFKMEKLQSKQCAYFIAASNAMRDYARNKYGVESNNFYVKPACVDLNKFTLEKKDNKLVERLKLNEKIICVYAGKVGGIYLKEEIFDFIKICYIYWGIKFKFIMLTNATNDEVLKEIQRINIPESVVFRINVKHDEIPKYLSLGDFAINPVKPVPTKRCCTSIKDGEYWAMGLPIIITKNISDDSEIISKSGYGYVLNNLNNEEYREAIRIIEKLISGNVNELKKNIRKIAEKYRNYKIAEEIYTEIYCTNA